MRPSYPGVGRLTIGLFALNLALQLADFLATYVGCGTGLPEGNPLVRCAMNHLGLGPGLAAVKCAAVFCLGYLWIVRANRLVPAALTITATVYLVLAIVPWTVVLLGSVTV
jgi:hypothetical protein